MPRLLPLLLAVVAMAGCPKPTPSTTAPTRPAEGLDLEAAPRLPAPIAGSYARVVDLPPDPVVTAAVGSRTWEASLGGAAAGLALDAKDGAATWTARSIRWAAWRAGVPWPVEAYAAWPVPPKGPVPPPVPAWLERQPAERDVGVARARTRTQEVWVALAATPRMELPALAKQRSRGSPLVLPATPGATARVVDPTGQLIEVDLDTAREFELASEGEWIVQVVAPDDRGRLRILAHFPLYVDMEPSTAPLLPNDDTPADDPEAGLDVVRELWTDIRAEFGVVPFAADPLLDGAAATWLRDPDRSIDDLARTVSVAPEDLEAWICTARSVETCVDRALYDPRRRHLATRRAAMVAGFAVTQHGAGVRVAALVAPR